MNETVELAYKYGLGIVYPVFILLYMGWMLKNVLINNEKRENKLQDLIQMHISKLDSNITLLTQMIIKYENSVALIVKTVEISNVANEKQNNQLIANSVEIKDVIHSLNNKLK